MDPLASPIDWIGRVIEPGMLPSTPSLEFGVICKLVHAAWIGDVPCTLPDDDILLATLAGVTDELWRAMKPRVLRLLRAQADPGACHWVLPLAQRVYGEALDLVQRRKEQTRPAMEAARKRRSEGVAETPNGSVTEPAAANSELQGVKERSAPQRSKSENESKRDQSAKCSVQGLSAGARALEEDLLTEKKSEQSEPAPEITVGSPCPASGASAEGGALQLNVELRKLKLAKCDRDRVRRMLKQALWSWAPEGRRTLPPTVVDDLCDRDDVTPCHVAFVLERIGDMHRVAVDKAKPLPDPIKVMITGLGGKGRLVGKRPPPWEIHLGFRTKWDKQEAEYARSVEIQGRLDKLRAERGVPFVLPRVNA